MLVGAVHVALLGHPHRLAHPEVVAVAAYLDRAAVGDVAAQQFPADRRLHFSGEAAPHGRAPYTGS